MRTRTGAVILSAYLLSVAFSCVYVPWRAEYRRGEQFALGHAFLWEPPTTALAAPKLNPVAVDFARVGLMIAALTAVFGVAALAVWALRNPRGRPASEGVESQRWRQDTGPRASTRSAPTELLAVAAAIGIIALLAHALGGSETEKSTVRDAGLQPAPPRVTAEQFFDQGRAAGPIGPKPRAAGIDRMLDEVFANPDPARPKSASERKASAAQAPKPSLLDEAAARISDAPPKGRNTATASPPKRSVLEEALAEISDETKKGPGAGGISSPPHLRPVTRPANGESLIRFEAVGGLGRLRVRNGTSDDAAVKLLDTATGQALRLVYARGGGEIEMVSIPPGVYVLQFALGHDWLRELTEFSRKAGYTAFVKPFSFDETPDGESIKYATFTVTLHRVRGGNAPSLKIDEQEFRRGLMGGSASRDRGRHP